MQSRFTKKAQEALDHAAETAAMLGHGYIGSEHLLIGLIQAEDSLASTVLLNNDVTAEKIINLIISARISSSSVFSFSSA
jgi:ATP-dependent Clp protease ATP-binding subunit ClpC